MVQIFFSYNTIAYNTVKYLVFIFELLNINVN